MNKALIKKTAWLYLLLIVAFLTMATSVFGQDGGSMIFLPIVMGGAGNGGSTITPTPIDITPTVTQTVPEGTTPTVAPPRRDQSVFGVAAEAGSGESDFQQIAQGGADWVRPGLTVDWAAVEPSVGERNWATLSGFETQVLTANDQGQSIIVTLANTPDWALMEQGSGKCGPIATDKLPAFADFLQDLVSRYSRPPYNVRDWELWSEPETLACWGSDDPFLNNGSVYYAIMLQTAYPTIHTIDPYAAVWMGPLEMRCDPSTGRADCTRMDTFLKGVLLSSGDYLDGIAFHANDGLAITDLPWGMGFQYNNVFWQSAWNTTGPVVNVKTAYLKDVMAQVGRENGMPPKELLAHIAEQCPCGGDLFPQFESAKASYVAQVYAAAAANGLRAAVWQSWQGNYMTGLLANDGSLTPAYTALQVSSASLNNAVYTRPVTEADNLPADVQGYHFSHDDDEILVLWYTTLTQPQEVILTFDRLPLAAWDLLGKPIPTDNGVPLAEQPIYVQLPLP